MNKSLATVPLVVALYGCEPPPNRQYFPAPEAVENGRAIVDRVGCAACHDIPGIDWPKGKVGPPLDGFAGRPLIAGRVPNRPDLLAAFVRDAPAVVPGTAMPIMPITEEESRDVAAFLYTLRP